VDGVLVSVLTEALHRSREIADASRQQLRSLVENAPISLAMFDRNRRYMATSRRWVADLGHGAEAGKLSGRHHDEAHPDFPAQLRQALGRGLAGEVIESSDELWIRADGRRTLLRWAVHPWRDSHGAIGGIVVMAEDITARKQIEEQQVRSQKLEALGTLAGGIAHDFNNILLAISGNAQLSLADLPPDDPNRESLEEIAKASARAAALVRRILGFSRPQEQRIETVHLGPVVEEALKLLRATLPAMIEIRTTSCPELPPVAADSSQIHQVLMNLVTNAAQAIGDGVGLIEVGLDVTDVTAETAGMSPELREGRYCTVSISDNGCGMDPATQDRVFDPFFTTKSGSGGTGLGLSVVHGIMKSHHAAVTVESQPGKGTTFRLHFPAADGGAAPVAVAPGEVARGRGERVLYVDDDEALVLLAQRTLEALGYAVTGTTDPARALQDFRSRPTDFDLVVTDLSMPGMSGLQLARALHSIRPGLPIVMTSGYVRPDQQEAARAAGVRELILKPDTADELGRVLERVLQGPKA